MSPPGQRAARALLLACGERTRNRSPASRSSRGGDAHAALYRLTPAGVVNAEREYRPFPNEGHRNWSQEHLEIPLLLALLRLPRGVRVLEIGTGRGVALEPFARRLSPSLLIGLDIDLTLLAEARRQASSLLLCGDARNLPWRDRSFDVVIDFGTCYHIARAADALREIARVLAPGGYYVSETRLSQFISHPVRSHGRRLPWEAVPWLVKHRSAGLWQAHQGCGP